MKPVSYFETIDEALKEVRERRLADAGEGLITKIENSPYGGFRVVSTPAELLVDEAADGLGTNYASRNPFLHSMVG